MLLCQMIAGKSVWGRLIHLNFSKSAGAAAARGVMT